MEDKTLGIIGIVALGIVALIVAYLAFLSRNREPILTMADIERAREIVRRAELG